MRRRTAVQPTLLTCVVLALACASTTLVHAAEPPQLKTASNHPIPYYLSLPEGWIAFITGLDTQMQAAMSLAEAHGYKNVSLTRVEGKGHERMADEVLAYFSSLMQ